MNTKRELCIESHCTTVDTPHIITNGGICIWFMSLDAATLPALPRK